MGKDKAERNSADRPPLNIKEPSVAGMFYPDDPDRLRSLIADFAARTGTFNQPAPGYASRAVIVPHAGLVYSGQLAYTGLSCLFREKTADTEAPCPRTVFIFAPAHRAAFDGLALSSYGAWKTPLGTVPLDTSIIKEITRMNGGGTAAYNDEAFTDEHAVEIQLPLLQKIAEDAAAAGNALSQRNCPFSVVPVLTGRVDPSVITDIIERYYGDPSCAFVISSDLSHFYSAHDSEKIDTDTAAMIETSDTDALLRNSPHKRACGADGIMGLIRFAAGRGWSLIRVGMTNSGVTSGDMDRVVGYGGWMLCESARNEFIKTRYAADVLHLCRKSIRTGLAGTQSGPGGAAKLPAVFDEDGACFVTLEKDGALRGCIGSIVARRPLAADIWHNARSAAFEDPRFPPLGAEEFTGTDISVSLLSEPEDIVFSDEQDLLDQLVPGTDGLIIRDGSLQAVYLPSVWEQLPGKKEFLQSLKRKAGMPAGHFSRTFTAWRFYSVYVSEK